MIEYKTTKQIEETSHVEMILEMTECGDDESPLIWLNKHREQPAFLRRYNWFVLLFPIMIERDIIRPILMKLLSRKHMALLEYIIKHHVILSDLHLLTSVVWGSLMWGYVIGAVSRIIQSYFS